MLCVRRLRLGLHDPHARFDFSASQRMKRVARVLHSLPNLTDLVIEWCGQHDERVTNLLNAAHFPFCLKKFSCGTDINNHIGPFLRSQSGIESYDIEELGFSLGPNAKKDAVRSPTEHDLPNLQRIAGPYEAFPTLLKGRTIQRLDVSSYHIVELIRDLYHTFYLLDQTTQDKLIAGADGLNGSRTNTPNLSMDFRTFSGHHHIPIILSTQFSISLSSIRSLKVNAYGVLAEGFARALKHFPALECLEWHSTSFWNVREPWVAAIVQGCAESAPTLRRISFGAKFEDLRVWRREAAISLEAAEQTYIPPPPVLKDPTTNFVDFVDDLAESSVDEDDTEEYGNMLGSTMLPIRCGVRWVWRLETIPALPDGDGEWPWEITSS